MLISSCSLKSASKANVAVFKTAIEALEEKEDWPKEAHEAERNFHEADNCFVKTLKPRTVG